MANAPLIEAGITRANGHVARRFALSLMTGLAIGAGTFSTTEADTPASAVSLNGCVPYANISKYRNHEYEVCTAYVANSAQIALQGFYKFGNNRSSFLADSAKHHFETRYWEQPRQSIEQEVDSWPKTKSIFGNRVAENIDIASVSSSLKADRGLLRTSESWEVTTPSGETLHHESRHFKNITMCRGKLPGHVLHEWVVVKFIRDPQFNCVTFDKQHGIAP